MEIITPEPTPPIPLTEEETKELRYIRSRYMDKYEGGPPWRGDEAYLANIQYLEAELVRVRLILRKIEYEAEYKGGSQSGIPTIENLAQEGLRIPV